MGKVALVNLSKFADVGTAPEFQKGLAVLAMHGIATVDYASAHLEPQTMVHGLHQAIDDPSVSVILTYSGGNTAISCLDLIDWEKVGYSGKVFAGLSDFTHFSWKAVESGAQCVYGLALKDFVKYRITEEERRPGIEFLKSGKVVSIAPVLLRGSDVVTDWNIEKIIGGHSFISMLMVQESKINLSSRILMLEHHYNQAEDLGDLRYWGQALSRAFRSNRPKAVLLGRSMIMDAEGGSTSFESANNVFCDALDALGCPVYVIDHFAHLIPFKAA